VKTKLRVAKRKTGGQHHIAKSEKPKPPKKKGWKLDMTDSWQVTIHVLLVYSIITI